MNDSTEKLLRDLEAVTGRGDPPEGDLDAHVAPLREGWLSFGRLLDAAQAALPEPDQAWPIAPPARRTRWRAAALVAVAASLLVAATAALALRAIKTRDTVDPSGGTIFARQPESVPEAPRRPVKKDVVPGPIERTPREAPAIAAAPAWDDSLDDAITSAGQSLVRIEQDWTSTGGRLDEVQAEIQQMRREVEGGTL